MTDIPTIKKIAKFNKVDDDQVLVHSGIDEGIKNIFHLLKVN